MTRNRNNRLTIKERAIVRLLVEGYPIIEIAEFLGISTHSVEEHCSRVMIKLKVNDVTGLVKFAIYEDLLYIEN
jgi:DNA-binding CsgD family transcriptional regulator